MNKIINKFLLTGDKFMPELHLKQPDLLIVLVDHLPNTAKEFKKFRKTCSFKSLYRNESKQSLFCP